MKTLAATPTMPISAIRIGQRVRKDLGDIDSLIESIKARGLLQPIVVTPNGQLIAGRRRLEALTRMGETQVPVRVIDIDELILGERDENAVRKDLTPTEKVALGRAIQEREEELSHQRMRDAGISNLPTVSVSYGNLPPLTKGTTRDRVGAHLGWGGNTYERARKVVEAAESEPEAFGDLVPRLDSETVNHVYKVMKSRQEQTPPPRSKKGRAVNNAAPRILDNILVSLSVAVEALREIDGSQLPADRTTSLENELTKVIQALSRVRRQIRGEAA